MPAIETEGANQFAVLWAYSAPDSHGQPTVEAAVEIAARWEWGQRQVMTAESTPITCDASVMVDQEIAMGSLLWQGELADLPDPVEDVVLYEVVGKDTTPDVKGRSFQRNVFVRKWRESLPTIV